jgi:hypothetical protein
LIVPKSLKRSELHISCAGRSVLFSAARNGIYGLAREARVLQATPPLADKASLIVYLAGREDCSCQGERPGMSAHQSVEN